MLKLRVKGPLKRGTPCYYATTKGIYFASLRHSGDFPDRFLLPTCPINRSACDAIIYLSFDTGKETISDSLCVNIAVFIILAVLN